MVKMAKALKIAYNLTAIKLKIPKILKSREATVIVAVILLVIIFVGYQLSKNGQAEVIEVGVGSVVERVTISGKTKAAKEATLAFEVGGKVTRVAKQAGEPVAAGELIVALDQTEFLASLAEARANLTAEEAGLVGGTSGVSSTKVESAEATLRGAESNLQDKISDAFTRADDAVRNTGDQFFDNAGGASSVLNFYVADQDLRGRLGVNRYQMELMLNDWQTELAGGSNINQAAPAAARLDQTKLFMTDVAAAVNSLVGGDSTEQTTFDTYRSSVSTARANINTAISNLSAAKEKYTTALNNLQIEKGDTKGQLARVEQARAKVLSAQAQLAKRSIFSPINGVVTKQEATVGEIISAGEAVTGVISTSNLQVEAFVPEVHVGKVKPGDKVVITLDAFPGETFSGQILNIDLGETIVGGVPNYKTEVAISGNDPRLKTGLTANLEVETARKDGVVTVPRFALEEKAGQMFVKKLVNSELVLTPVTVGLLGTDGQAETISGLSAGDKVIVGK